MEINEFQRLARRTDQRPGQEPEDLVVHFLGLVGEAGSVATEYKKMLRDGPAHLTAKARLREELGDVLWYTSTLASKLGLDLEDVARANLEKTVDRWLRSGGELLDSEFPAHEQLPRLAAFTFSPLEGAQQPTNRLSYEGVAIGDPLTDASHEPDGYRFHDVFHLAHAAVLGWSPVLRKLMSRKRRSSPAVDEAEDGGRAIVIEEGVAALVFAYATSHNYLANVSRLDHQLLDTIQTLVAPLEVSSRSSADWERAVLMGYAGWRALRASGKGTVVVDMHARVLRMAD